MISIEYPGKYPIVCGTPRYFAVLGCIVYEYPPEQVFLASASLGPESVYYSKTTSCLWL